MPEMISAVNPTHVGMDRFKKLIDGSWDVDTLVAYFCFTNLGWSPSRYESLPSREKMLVAEFSLKYLHDQKAITDKLKAR